MSNKILVINPGSTSTKLAYFEGDNRVYQETLVHSNEELAPFAWIMDQVDYRLNAIETWLKGKNIDVSSLNAIISRGGMIPPCASGTYVIDSDMTDYMYSIVNGAHASNLGCVLALKLASPNNIPAYICDPVTVDEMPEIARITGIPEIKRRMIGHALNCRAMAMKCAQDVMHKPLEECRFIVLHLGGGASVRLFVGGKMVDNVRDDELLFAPERSGGTDLESIIKLCYSGKYTEKEMMKKMRGKGGLVAWLGTSDVLTVEQKALAGDEQYKLIYDAMLYTAAKSIGALAAAADGKIDRIILTGGICRSDYVYNYLNQKCSFIAPVEKMGGEFEMEALMMGATRVLDGEETPHYFKELLAK